MLSFALIAVDGDDKIVAAKGTAVAYLIGKRHDQSYAVTLDIFAISVVIADRIKGLQTVP